MALGIPVLTADYDFWIHIDDIAAFNDAIQSQGLLPSRTAALDDLTLTKRA